MTTEEKLIKQFRKKIKCPECNGKGGFEDFDTGSDCSSCQGEGFRYRTLEEEEAFLTSSFKEVREEWEKETIKKLQDTKDFSMELDKLINSLQTEKKGEGK